MSTATSDHTELLEELGTHLDAMWDSDEWHAWLDTAARFPRYSLHNGMLILHQLPTATLVMGYGNKAGTTGWKSLGRQVKKGERALRIFAPQLRKNDDDESVVVGFRLVPVFDLSQTEGDALPASPTQMWREAHDAVTAPAEVFGALVDAAAHLDVGVEVVPDGSITGGARGVFNIRTRDVEVCDAAPASMAATLLHELGHALDPELVVGADRAEDEVVAQSVAYIVGRVIGLDVERVSAVYLAAWKGKSEDLARLSARILPAVRSILEGLGIEGEAS